MANWRTIGFFGTDVGRGTPAERSRAGLSLQFQVTSVLPGLSVYERHPPALTRESRRPAPLEFPAARWTGR